MRRIESLIFSCQLRQCREALQILTQRFRRCSPECHALPPKYLLGEHASLASEHHAFPDVCMLAHAHLASDNDLVLDYDAAGKSCLGRNDDVLADLAVVADVNEIVYLCAAANTSSLKRAAVYGCVGPDFDVVFDYQLSDLGELFVPSSSGIADVSEAVAAENRAGVDDHAIANASAGINRDIGMNCAVIADCGSLADDASGADPGAAADNSVFVHDRASVNCDAFA